MVPVSHSKPLRCYRGPERLYNLLFQPNLHRICLLVDLKGEPKRSINLVYNAIAPIQSFLSRVDRWGTFRPGRVTVVESGNRPQHADLFLANKSRYFFIDGRPHDLFRKSDITLVPIVSDSWRSPWLAFGRNGRLRQLARRAHQQGKLLRVWGAPNREDVWRHMVESGIDLLSVDHRERFARFASSGVLQ